MKKKRWTIKIALCLLAGAVVTWGVAWGLAIWGPGIGIPLSPPYTFAGDWPIRVSESWPPPNSYETERNWARRDRVWTHVREFEGGRDLRTQVFIGESGWPWLGLAMVDAGLDDSYRSTWILLREWNPNQGLLRVPTRVLPLGFALNTLFYAAVVLGVVEGVAFARRRVRPGKGRCPSCGYDRAGLEAGVACPECGGLSGGAAGSG